MSKERGKQLEKRQKGKQKENINDKGKMLGRKAESRKRGRAKAQEVKEKKVERKLEVFTVRKVTYLYVLVRSLPPQKS